MIGVAYVNTNKQYAAGYVGTEAIDPSLVSFYDYQFLYPTQVLLTVKPSGAAKSSVPFPYGMPLNSQFTSYSSLYKQKPNVTRTFIVVSRNCKIYNLIVLFIVFDFKIYFYI